MTQKLDMFDLHSDLYQMAFMQTDLQAMQHEVSWAKDSSNEYRMIANEAQALAFSGRMTEARKLFRLAIALTVHAGLNQTVAEFRSLMDENATGMVCHAHSRHVS